MPTNVYIDGFNFYFGAAKGTAWKWVDLEALARLLVPDDELGTIHYFTAHVAERYPGDETPRRQAVYIRAVRANPRINVVLGHFKSRSKWRSLDDRTCDKALVIGNDADLEDAIRKARQLGCTIGLVNPQAQPTNRRLLDVANFEIPFRRDALAKCQLPNTVTTDNGRQIHRPAAWR